MDPSGFTLTNQWEVRWSTCKIFDKKLRKQEILVGGAREKKKKKKRKVKSHGGRAKVATGLHPPQ